MLNLKPIQICFILSSFLLRIALSLEDDCKPSNQSRTRVFHNLLDFQENQKSYFHNKASYSGNDVTFLTKNIYVIPKNAFVAYDSTDIQRLHLNDKNIQEIEDDAFAQLNCLVSLNLNNNSLFKISKYMFAGLTFLHELYLADNFLTDIPDYAFSYLRNLRILSLAKNKLHLLNSESFFKLSFLQFLDLSYNNFKTLPIEPLRYLKMLLNLQISSNKLTKVDLENWEGGYNLTILNISDNLLKNFNLSANYTFASSLSKLYLQKNRLQTLFLKDVKLRFPYLFEIDINDNFWSCPDLITMCEIFQASDITLQNGNTKNKPNVIGISCISTNSLKLKHYKNKQCTALKTNVSDISVQKFKVSPIIHLPETSAIIATVVLIFGICLCCLFSKGLVIGDFTGQND